MKYFCILLFFVFIDAQDALAVKINVAARGADTAYSATDTTADSVIHKRSLSVGINYGSDVQFFGRTGPVTYPFVSADAIYNTKNGIFVYGSGLKVLGYNAFFDEIDLGAGYLYTLSKQFTGNVSYTRFLFNRDAAQIIKSASSNDIDLKNTYNWGFFKSSVTLDYLFGKEDDFFLTINASKHFESNWSIFDDKDYLTFDPVISAILGTQNFVQKYSLDHQYRVDEDNIYIRPIDEPRMAHDNSMFNMLNYSFKLPIAYNRPHYTIEFSYKYSIPVNVEGVLMNRRESFYNLTFYYVFY